MPALAAVPSACSREHVLLSACSREHVFLVAGLILLVLVGARGPPSLLQDETSVVARDQLVSLGERSLGTVDIPEGCGKGNPGAHAQTGACDRDRKVDRLIEVDQTTDCPPRKE